MESMAIQTAVNPRAGSFAPLRVDPYAISERVTVRREDGMDCIIDRGGVSFKQKGKKSGLPLSMALPSKAFEGVAVRVLPVQSDNDRSGKMAEKNIVMIELHHKDPQLCVPVLIADNLDDVAADWHSWSRLLKLPMLAIREDNMVEPVRKEIGRVMVEDPIVRRRRITSPKWRPWFLKLRRDGAIGSIEKISASQIIARN